LYSLSCADKKEIELQKAIRRRKFFMICKF
jgi:hypothetical protein